jgi:16S rRNA (adenine1518-N6/adenine1519-N6)-dimethyltransferase
VDALEPTATDVVLEIGPGTGALTRQLAPRVARVVAIEKDARLVAECSTRNAERGVHNVELVRADALKVDWPALLPPAAVGNSDWKLVGNIPYYITTPLLEKALAPPVCERVVFLVQAEVGDRIVAPPGSRTYGALSIGVQIASRAEKLFRVKAGAFHPAPGVDSVVVRLWPLRHPPLAVEALAQFRRFVTGCFSQRRKQLQNVLRGVTGWGGARVGELLERLEIDRTVRPEVLGPEEFLALWQQTLRRVG